MLLLGCSHHHPSHLKWQLSVKVDLSDQDCCVCICVLVKITCLAKLSVSELFSLPKEIVYVLGKQ